MALILGISWHPTPFLDGADDSLAAFVDVDVLDANPLLAFAPMLVEGENQVGVGGPAVSRARTSCGILSPSRLGGGLSLMRRP